VILQYGTGYQLIIQKNTDAISVIIGLITTPASEITHSLTVERLSTRDIKKKLNVGYDRIKHVIEAFHQGKEPCHKIGRPTKCDDNITKLIELETLKNSFITAKHLELKILQEFAVKLGAVQLIESEKVYCFNGGRHESNRV